MENLLSPKDSKNERGPALPTITFETRYKLPDSTVCYGCLTFDACFLHPEHLYRQIISSRRRAHIYRKTILPTDLSSKHQTPASPAQR